MTHRFRDAAVPPPPPAIKTLLTREPPLNPPPQAMMPPRAAASVLAAHRPPMPGLHRGQLHVESCAAMSFARRIRLRPPLQLIHRQRKFLTRISTRVLTAEPAINPVSWTT